MLLLVLLLYHLFFKINSYSRKGDLIENLSYVLKYHSI